MKELGAGTSHVSTELSLLAIPQLLSSDIPSLGQSQWVTAFFGQSLCQCGTALYPSCS